MFWFKFLSPRRKVEALGDSDTLMFVCSFVRLSPTRTDSGGGLARRPPFGLINILS